MSKWAKIFIFISIIFSIVMVYFLFKSSNTIDTQRQTITDLQSQVEQLNAKDFTTVYYTKVAVASGTTVDETSLYGKEVPTSIVSPENITDIQEIKTSMWKIPVAGETMITKSMLTHEYVNQSDRTDVIAVDYITPSLKVGDYVDINVRYPNKISSEGIVKKRVINIYEDSIEVVLNSTESLVYAGMLQDRDLNKGVLITANAYLDPTLQKKSVSMYVPPANILEYMAINKNMPSFPYNESSNYTELRSQIESYLPYYVYGSELYNNDLQMLQDRDSMLSAGNDKITSTYVRARSQYIEAIKQMAELQGVPVEGYQTGMSEVYSSTGGAGKYNEETYIDSNGVERYPDGTAVSAMEDVISTGGGTDYSNQSVSDLYNIEKENENNLGTTTDDTQNTDTTPEGGL